MIINFTIISPFGIDGNTHNPPVTIPPLVFMLLIFLSLGRGLVKIYAICSFVPMYSNLIFFYGNHSRRKWKLIKICLVLECITGFLDIIIALTF
jgi:hypothetical protein